ncbi:MAG: tetraacyldisaccharide 4'-kinase [Hyphomonadaceae bacterium]|nr:tetraacyldisaccharide 4'-kinase [Hyphomonadaceae bacterium]
MQPPHFWSGDAAGRDAAPLLQALLAPLGAVYGWGAAARRAWTRPAPIPIPIVCIGNLTLGGAGKTPVARAIRRKLGEGAHVLSRGYGGAARGPLRVAADASFREVGDEPLLHAGDGPAWIARDRVAGAEAAVAGGARALILDDGFQNPTLKPDLSIIVIDAEAGLGNRRVFPAGPLRERAADGLKRADAILLQAGSRAAAESATFPFDGPVLRGWLAPKAPAPSGPLVAFAGIARPRKFFDALRAAGADVQEEIPYPDHHVFDESELAWLATLAQERGARLVTTEKDHVRLDARRRGEIAAWPVEARFLDEAALDALLAPVRARVR